MIDSGWYQLKSSAGTPAGIWQRVFTDRGIGQIERMEVPMETSEGSVIVTEYWWSLGYASGHVTAHGTEATLEQAMMVVDRAHNNYERRLLRQNVISLADPGHGHQAQLRIESYRRPH